MENVGLRTVMCVYRFCISDAELGLRIEAVWGTVRDRYYKEMVNLCNTECLNAEIFCMLCNHTAAVSCHLFPAMLARIAARACVRPRYHCVPGAVVQFFLLVGTHPPHCNSE
jgi:hypothetical protein